MVKSKSLVKNIKAKLRWDKQLINGVTTRARKTFDSLYEFTEPEVTSNADFLAHRPGYHPLPKVRAEDIAKPYEGGSEALKYVFLPKYDESEDCFSALPCMHFPKLHQLIRDCGGELSSHETDVENSIENLFRPKKPSVDLLLPSWFNMKIAQRKGELESHSTHRQIHDPRETDFYFSTGEWVTALLHSLFQLHYTAYRR